MAKEKIKEIHHYYYYYPCYLPQTLRYYGPWHSILPPPTAVPNGYYEPTATSTTYKERTTRYDSI